MLGQDGREYRLQAAAAQGGGFCPAAPATARPHGTLLCCSSSQRKWSCCGVISSLLSSAGICLLVVAYTVLGAITFMALEGRGLRPTSTVSAPNPGDERLRSQTVEKLWSITEDLNILYKENWTRLAEQEVLKFQDSLVRKYKRSPGGKRNHIWSFPSSFLYSLTLITTIGYGSVSPRTAWGRMATVAYALLGIPLMLIYLSTVGDSLARNFRRLYGRLHRSGSKDKAKKEPAFAKTALQNHIPAEQKPPAVPDKVCVAVAGAGDDHLHHDHRQRVPLLVTLSVVVGYISAGAFLFNRLESWTFLEGSYFCFTSLGTIGFGELIPGTMDSDTEQVSVLVSSAYILVGMAVIAMCFNLVQDETVVLVRKVALWMRKDERLGREEQDTVPMSVVSS